MELNWESQQGDLRLQLQESWRIEDRSRHHFEVATGNLKLNQAKSQSGKMKLQPLCYLRTLRESRPITEVAT